MSHTLPVAGPSSPRPCSSQNAVPKPTEAFADYIETVTAALDRVTSLSAKLPSGSDLAFHRTMEPSLARGLDDASGQVLQMAERLLSLVAASQAAKVKGKRRKLEEEEDVVAGFRGAVGGVVDGLLEDADSQLDELRGDKKKAAIVVDESAQAKHAAKGRSARFAGFLPERLRNAPMDKPQAHFDPPVDNRNRSEWTHSLTQKAHSMVGLDFDSPLIYTLTDAEKEDRSLASQRKSREIKMQKHPYYYETRHLPYPTWMFQMAEPRRPPSEDATPVAFVDTLDGLNEMIEHLRSVREIAVDLEHHQTRSYMGFTCLIQISTRDRDFVVDSIKLRKEIRHGKLGGVMVDPSIVKVFHGAESDIPWLQRDFDIFVVNMFDTHHATNVLALPSHSLAGLLKMYCDVDADKRYQMADWRIRPLPEEMLAYARSDTHWLLFIYDNLRNALLAKSSRPPSPSPNDDSGSSPDGPRQNPQEAMRIVLERSANTALKLYQPDYYDMESGRGTGGWASSVKKWLPREPADGIAVSVFKRLHAWRDALARKEDESPHYVLQADVLANLAKRRPTTTTSVLAVLGTRAPPLARQHAADIVQTIQEAKIAYETQQSTSQPSSDIDAATSSLVSLPNAPTQSGAIPARMTRQAAKISALQAPPPKPDLEKWLDVWANTSKVQDSQPAIATPVSGLFGNSLKGTKRASQAPGKKKTAVSSMFGASLGGARGVKDASPGFADVMRDIHSQFTTREVEPSASTLSGSQGAEQKPTTLQPETVPFVPAASRSTIPESEVPNATTAPEVSAPSTKAKDEIVAVKKKKQRKRDRAISAAATSATGASGPAELNSKKAKVEPGDASTTPKPKEKKVKKEIGEIPVFDYTTAPNLLDNPESASRGADGDKKKRKKRKDKQKTDGPNGMIETPRFGKMPRDLSQPKQGNKSGTF